MYTLIHYIYVHTVHIYSDCVFFSSSPRYWYIVKYVCIWHCVYAMKHHCLCWAWNNLVPVLLPHLLVTWQWQCTHCVSSVCVKSVWVVNFVVPTFLADQTPTPTRFLKLIDQEGLFDTLKDSPFDQVHTYVHCVAVALLIFSTVDLSVHCRISIKPLLRGNRWEWEWNVLRTLAFMDCFMTSCFAHTYMKSVFGL